MTKRILRWALLAGAGALALSLVTACGDDSTASAPITQPVTTTSMYSGSPQTSGSATSSQANETPDGTDTSKPGMPATNPNSATSQPADFPGGTTAAPVSDKGKKYLAALKKMNVTFMGDTDNTIALTMADYICAQRSKGGDQNVWKAIVLASTSPGTKDALDANAKADKVIKAAVENYC
ncbi:DUF732 domain-containing protein [Gordonia sp. TBRC 11910]|uniref:DUF732 domain-containing protein n=1 Tax=Gordonia asplenii TaxID=2725283 RepID=A0A848KWJ9_9ACTN|nr:DUF732 domain-containing protein [Gordonia asplenii]NMO02980.1 DUF732 domain-containing protein [Gordonia asplenii]